MGRASGTLRDSAIGRFVRPLPILWIVAASLGALHAWIGRQASNPDGVSYLDMGDAYLRGDWQMAVNGHWSPLYTWLTGLGLLVAGRSPNTEYPVVHLVNFLIYLLALGAFHFMLRELIRHNHRRTNGGLRDERLTFPDWAWLGAGYALFVWSSLHLIGLELISPDLCLAGFVYLITGLLLRITSTKGRLSTFVALGAALGLGYLAKAPLFPLSAAYLGVALLVGGIRRTLPRVPVAIIAFLIVAGPFVVAVSRASEHLTFGESARLNCAWHINHIIPYVHWQGGDPESGKPAHPTRQVLSEPAVYEFASPVGGTYPPWYDPTYWNEGVKPYLDPVGMARSFWYMARYWCIKVFVGPVQLGLIAGLLAVWLASRGGSSAFEIDRAAHGSLILPALAGLLMFSLAYLSMRYVAAFAVVLWLGILSAVRLADSADARRILHVGSVLMVTLMWIAVGDATLRRVYERGDPHHVSHGGSSPHRLVAEGLVRMGLRPGDPVGCMESGFDASRWARLAQVKIIAELPPQGSLEGSECWAVDYMADPRVIRAFADAGAKVIVARDVPVSLRMKGWRRIGKTRHYALMPNQFAAAE